MITQKDLDEIQNRLKESFITKDDFSEYNKELFNKLNSIVKKQELELVENRVFNLKTKLQITHQ